MFARIKMSGNLLMSKEETRRKGDRCRKSSTCSSELPGEEYSSRTAAEVGRTVHTDGASSLLYIAFAWILICTLSCHESALNRPGLFPFAFLFWKHLKHFAVCEKTNWIFTQDAKKRKESQTPACMTILILGMQMHSFFWRLCSSEVAQICSHLQWHYEQVSAMDTLNSGGTYCSYNMHPM
jgi:hypothetical protein